MIETAEQEKEDDKLKDQIRVISDWLDENPQLNARRDTAIITRFITSCKFDIPTTKTKMKNYYEMRSKYREWFENRDPELNELKTLLKLGVFVPLDKKDAQGRTLILVQAAIYNPRKNSMLEVFKVGIMGCDCLLEEDESIAENGLQVIVDLKKVGLLHALQLTPQLIRRAVHTWQDCYPVKIKGMHFINCPPHVNVILNIFRQFMKEKLKSRLFVHGTSLSSFHSALAPIFLPVEYGGTSTSIKPQIDNWCSKVLAKREWLLADEQYKATM